MEKKGIHKINQIGKMADIMDILNGSSMEEALAIAGDVKFILKSICFSGTKKELAEKGVTFNRLPHADRRRHLQQWMVGRKFHCENLGVSPTAAPDGQSSDREI